MAKKRILCLSGGGAKGTIQIQALSSLEQKYGPLYQYYDLICASSVGSINGSMLASGKISMVYAQTIYPDMVKKIFKKRIHLPLYDRKDFLDIWMKEIGSVKMKDCLTKVQITSLSLCDKRNHFFKSWETKDGELMLATAVCRSFAAPLYFGPIIDFSNNTVWLDGGMGVANMPILYALTESELLWPSDDYYFDIIGCGFANQEIPFKQAKTYHLVRQLGQYFNLEDGGLAREQVRQEQLSLITKKAKANPNKISFSYWDIQIPKEMDGMDKIRYLDNYQSYGLEMAKEPLIHVG